MLLADDKRRYVAANDAACDALGLSRDQITAMRIEDLAEPAMRPLVAGQWSAFIAAGSQSGPYMLETPDGEQHDLFYSATANVVPGLHLSMFINQELVEPELDFAQDSPTDSEGDEGRPIDTREVIEQILDNATTAMLIVDDKRAFVAANKALLDLLGATIEDLKPMSIDDVVPDHLKSTVTERFERFLEHGSQWGPVQLTTPGGRQLAVIYNATASIMPGMHLVELLARSSREPQFNFSHDHLLGETPGSALTTRERQVLTLLALGETNQSIAAELHLSPETIRNHTRSARHKLGARSRSHAIAIEVQTSQLDLDGAPPTS